MISNILKTTIAFSLIRKPTLIPRQLTTTAILAQEKKADSPKIEKKIEDKKENSKLIAPKKFLSWLVWKDPKNKEFYRVYGEWRCANKKSCGKRWKSAYTWISLPKYQTNAPISNLDEKQDYCQQECKVCNSKTNKLIKYEHLVLRDGEQLKPHRADLCAKCKSGVPCQKDNW